MRGQQLLIAERKAGRSPSRVWIDTDRDMLKCWADWNRVTPGEAHLQIDPQDRPELIDLRCIVGLTVLVEGVNAIRVAAVAKACKEHQAGRVLAIVCTPGGEYGLTVSTITDSKGSKWPT